jgi:hypothetical protein
MVYSCIIDLNILTLSIMEGVFHITQLISRYGAIIREVGIAPVQAVINR